MSVSTKFDPTIWPVRGPNFDRLVCSFLSILMDLGNKKLINYPPSLTNCSGYGF
jgi:hypothetical protein